MRNIFLGILLFGGFFFTSAKAKDLVSKDKMVFKVARSVFSIEDLKYIHTSLSDLKCMYDDSLLIRIFRKEFQKKYLKYLSYREEFSAKDKIYYLSLIDFYKLLVYSRSQNITVDSNVEKYLYITAQRNKCSMKAFDKNKKFNRNFKELINLEVFVRSRFLPTEKNNKTTDQDIKKAVLAAKNLLKSIGRQIEEEVYW